MNRLIILAGIALAVFILLQVNSGKIATNEILQVMVGADDVVEEEAVEEAVDEAVIENEEDTFSILAFGDVMLGRYVRVLMDERGKDYIFENLDWSEFGENDVMFANLEGPISGVGKKGGTGMTFSFNEDVAQYLKDYGFNVLSIVNNHALDQGWAGRDSTIAAFENVELGWCGHPTNEDFESVYYGVDGDITYAFICFDDVKGNVDIEAAKNLIWMTSSNVDYTIVSIHWGSEYKHQPHSVNQVEAGRAFVDAGADLVIGHHPHVVQSFETYNGAFIFYSLGNFVFDQYWSKDTQEELGIKAVLGEKGSYVELFPLKSELSQVRLMNEEEKSVWIEKFIKYGNYGEELKEQIRNGIISL